MDFGLIWGKLISFKKYFNLNGLASETFVIVYLGLKEVIYKFLEYTGLFYSFVTFFLADNYNVLYHDAQFLDVLYSKKYIYNAI